MEIRNAGSSREVTIINGCMITHLMLPAKQIGTLKIGDNVQISTTAVNPTMTKINNYIKTNEENIIWEQLQVCNGHG
jgi:hypothetical protein